MLTLHVRSARILISESGKGQVITVASSRNRMHLKFQTILARKKEKAKKGGGEKGERMDELAFWDSRLRTPRRVMLVSHRAAVYI